MSFFERYFELLDGPHPHSSLELVAEDVEFSIQWAADDTRKSSQFLGGREQLRVQKRRQRSRTDPRRGPTEELSTRHQLLLLKASIHRLTPS